MSTAFFDIQAALDSSMNTLAGATPVAWQYPGEGGPYKPVTGTLFLRPTHLPGNTSQAEASSAGKNFATGIYQVDVIAPLDSSQKTMIDWADDIADTFKRGTTHSYNGVNVRIRSASVGNGTRDGAWIVLPVTISYFVYTAAR